VTPRRGLYTNRSDAGRSARGRLVAAEIGHEGQNNLDTKCYLTGHNVPIIIHRLVIS